MTDRWLELGSGYAPTDGYLHLDANPSAPDVDFVGDAYPLPAVVVEAGPWERLRAVDVLEHLSYRWTADAVRQWCSVLAPGGELFIRVPDADAIMREYAHRAVMGRGWHAEAESCSALAGAEWRLLGGHADRSHLRGDDDWRLNAHYSLWSIDRLRELMIANRMQVVDLVVDDHPNIQLTALKLEP